MSLAEQQNDQSGFSYQMLFGMPEGHDARVLADKARLLEAKDQVLIHVALDDVRMANLSELLSFFAPDVKVIEFPAWDCLPYDRVSPHGDLIASRVAALSEMLKWEKETARFPKIVLTSINAITQRVTPKDALQGSVFNGKTGGPLEMEEFLMFLQKNGYIRTDTVREPGEYAIRGGIIDLYPPGYDNPVRIDLFGIEIDSIKTFDPVSQRSGKKLSSFNLYPATEYFLDEDSIAKFRSAYREYFGSIRSTDPLYEAVSAGRRYNGMDHWLPLFFDKMDTLFDYVPDAMITLDHHGEQARAERNSQIKDFYQSRKSLQEAALKQKKNAKNGMAASIYHPLPLSRLYLEDDEWGKRLDKIEQLSPFGAADNANDAGGRKGRDFSDIRALPDGDVFKAIADFISKQRSENKKVLVAAYTKGSRERLRSLLGNAGFSNLVNCEAYEDVKKLLAPQIGMILLGLENGFISQDITVLTEQDILGDRLTRKAKRKKAENFLTEVSSLNPGDLVVHIDHGIGRFDSLETLEAAGAHHDCLKIVYADDDRLFVPVENIDVLTRYGSEEGAAQLDRLGGAGWQARKARVKKDLMAMADQLLKIAAARELKKSDKIEVGHGLYQEFVSRFPYHETEDQKNSIHAVLDDMAAEHPMDRLVCGDVGFGKTEVALRAAYVAAMNGVQVAVVVPTTLLARQHYNSFVQRFEGMGIKIEQLSRLVTPKDAKLVKQGLEEGTVNIVIGTHALFSKHVRFKHLGLLIVDEEQRFGVKQKERLKELKENIHVLTLTATPIPRTLQMALTGVRDLSLIATPPVDRLAIRTFVLPFDPMVIREAILREHYRGGQTFYVCPRIKDLDQIEEQLEELVPEVKVISAHGQMSATDLEDRMSAFYDGQYQVLLATNIIESGLDIPTANTMIVHRADMFGLAQLYQIRGRIGRSKVRAYAYLTYDPAKKLTDQGQKRLEVIETLDTLGGGFQLASHDMDIRGAGNLLGEEQSGHVKEIGVELYQQMLEEAVAAAREGLDWASEEGAGEKWSPAINLGTSVLIPEHYVEDLNVRMSLYRRLSELDGKDSIDGFAAELIDRFGDLPEEVENLMDIVEIKQLCRTAGVDLVEAGPKGIMLRFYKNTPPNVESLMVWIAEKGGGVKLRPDQKLVAIRQWLSPQQRVKGVRSLIKELSDLVLS
jgi:transcription-repair coupling factor (superfamily II helicase)